ncbi:MAG TPA: class A beta-lactamase-related serine hydrolase [bacterium (Candidatus Stahlbacteria)]|nr:class A beta-lactamase-related serine hydrolase [Candidatus Stahlbacteria bacterium]
MRPLTEFLISAVVRGEIPGFALYVYDRGRESTCHHGHAQVFPKRRPIERDTVFDIASLTKVIATAPAVMKLYELGRLSLDDKIGKFLKEFKGKRNHDLTIYQLLNHSSGLRPWYPLYGLEEEARLPFLAELRPDFEPGTETNYSCLNYIILGVLIERITGSFKQFLKGEIFSPLGMEDTGFGPVDVVHAATTEVGNRHEEKLAEGLVGEDFNWRDYPITGEVHDGNSFYAYGGISGNAGLFSTIDDLKIFIRAYLDFNLPLKRETMELMERPFKGRGLGWVVKDDHTLFHAGFTGCGVWINRDEDYGIGFISNLIHPRVIPELGDRIRMELFRTFHAARS